MLTKSWLKELIADYKHKDYMLNNYFSVFMWLLAIIVIIPIALLDLIMLPLELLTFITYKKIHNKEVK